MNNILNKRLQFFCFQVACRLIWDLLHIRRFRGLFFLIQNSRRSGAMSARWEVGPGSTLPQVSFPDLGDHLAGLLQRLRTK